ncbi:hypothetical protein [Rhodoblastus sp.]|uniref:hypothetical protein n=1 Tax=Rhodoblastus sp. TaxID=1962975 RepID=UPI003F9435CE
MKRSPKTEEELSSLRADLQTSSAQRGSRAPTQEIEAASDSLAEDAILSQLETQLKELHQVLSDYADGVEGLVSEHPLVLAGAAFLLGVGVGRLARRG